MKLRREIRIPTRFRDEEQAEPSRRRSTASTPAPIRPTAPVEAPSPEPAPSTAIVPYPAPATIQSTTVVALSTPAPIQSTALAPSVQPRGSEMRSQLGEVQYTREALWDDDEPEPEIAEWPAPVDWNNLTNGMKLIVLSEFARIITFRPAIDFLNLNQANRNGLIQICRHEARLNFEETKRIERTNALQMELISKGIYDTESRNIIMNEEVYSKVVEPTTFTTTTEQVRKAKKFLSNFHTAEEYVVLIRPIGRQTQEDMEDYNRRISNLPNRGQVEWVKRQLDSYVGVGTCWYMLGLDEEVDWDVEREKVGEDGAVVTNPTANHARQTRGISLPNRQTEASPSTNAKDTEKKKTQKKSRRRKRAAQAEEQTRSPEAKHTPRVPSKLRNVILVEDEDSPDSQAVETKKAPIEKATSEDQSGAPAAVSSSPGPLKRKRSSLGRNPFK